MALKKKKKYSLPVLKKNYDTTTDGKNAINFSIKNQFSVEIICRKPAKKILGNQLLPVRFVSL